MIRIHVCYRWDDRNAAESIIRFLRERLDEEQVSSGMDGLATMPKNGGWLFVVVGRRWAENVGENERFTRQLATALKRSLRVVPLLVDGASIPPSGQVPYELQPLFRLTPWDLLPERWESDLERLLEILLGQSVASPRPASPAPSAQKARPNLAERFRSLLSRFRRVPSKRPKMREDAEETDYDLYDTSVPEAPAPESSEPTRRQTLVGSPIKKAEAPSPPAVPEPELPGASAPPPVKAKAPSPPPEPEPVLLGASAPTAVKPGSEFTAHFTAYIKEQEAEIRRILEKRSPRSEIHLGEEICQWRPGTKVKVRLRGRHLIVDPPEQEFIWKGGRNILAFDVEVIDEASEEIIVLKFDVFIEDSVVARLRMDLTISAVAEARVHHTLAVEPARTAFASYSSLDRLRVLDRVDALTTNAGIRFFMDCIDLHQGEEWKPALAKAIRLQELFMLFWSNHSAVSPWVDWELDLAKRHKPREFIQIQALQPDLPPPDGFEAIHGSSVYMWVREGNEAVRNRTDG